MDYQEIENKLIQFAHTNEGKEFPIHEIFVPTAVDFILKDLGIVSKSFATEYAEFCVMCDREKLPLICLEDYIKQYYC